MNLSDIFWLICVILSASTWTCHEPLTSIKYTPHLRTCRVTLGYVLITICSLPIQWCRYVRALSYRLGFPLYLHENTLNLLTPFLPINVWASLLMLLSLQSMVNIHACPLSIALPTFVNFTGSNFVQWIFV